MRVEVVGDYVSAYCHYALCALPVILVTSSRVPLSTHPPATTTIPAANTLCSACCQCLCLSLVESDTQNSETDTGTG